MLQRGERILNWIVDRPLGEGGMGQVYRAHNALTPRLVGALKVLVSSGDPNARARFVREAEALAALRHPVVVDVKDFGEVPGTSQLYLVMELAEGPTLQARLRSGPLTAAEAGWLFATLAEAVEHAHAAGVAHRDLKPANIILCHDGTLRLVDFGIATGEDWARITGDRLPGTPRYLAPEVFRAEGPVDPKALDVYAFGVTLYESLSGVEAFAADPSLSTPAELHASIFGRKLQQTAPLQIGPEFPETLRTALRTATQPNPALRPSMSVLRAMLAPEGVRIERTEPVVEWGAPAPRATPPAPPTPPAPFHAPVATTVTPPQVHAIPPPLPPLPPPPPRRRAGNARSVLIGCAAVAAVTAVVGLVAAFVIGLLVPTKPSPAADVAAMCSGAGINCDDAGALNDLGVQLYEQEEDEKAARLFARAIELDESVALYHANRASCLVNLNEWEEAKAEARRAMATGLKQHWTYVYLGLAQ